MILAGDFVYALSIYPLPMSNQSLINVDSPANSNGSGCIPIKIAFLFSAILKSYTCLINPELEVMTVLKKLVISIIIINLLIMFLTMHTALHAEMVANIQKVCLIGFIWEWTDNLDIHRKYIHAHFRMNSLLFFISKILAQLKNDLSKIDNSIEICRNTTNLSTRTQQ